MNSLYRKYDAFNSVYEEIRRSKPGARVDGFEAPKKYHHDPERLEVFNDFSHYFAWAGELYRAANKIASHLREIYNELNETSSSFYKLNTQKNLAKIYDKYEKFEQNLEDIYSDIEEFQTSMLATHISEKETEIGVLSDQRRNLLDLENRIIESYNRKLNEVSSSKISFWSLFLSFIAIVLATTSLLKDRFSM